MLIEQTCRYSVILVSDFDRNILVPLILVYRFGIIAIYIFLYIHIYIYTHTYIYLYLYYLCKYEFMNSYIYQHKI